MRYHQTLVARLASKLVLDILPATTASLIGGVLFAHYGLGRVTEPAAQVTPASAEMMQLLRDEHGVIVSFLNAQVEREKAELASGDALRQGSGEAAAKANIPARTPVTAKPASPRTRDTVAATVSAPLVIAQVQQAEDTSAPPSPTAQVLIAKTMGLKDRVVSVTHRVVSAFGGIPSWMGLIGDHLGGTDPKSHPLTNAVATS